MLEIDIGKLLLQLKKIGIGKDKKAVTISKVIGTELHELRSGLFKH